MKYDKASDKHNLDYKRFFYAELPDKTKNQINPINSINLINLET